MSTVPGRGPPYNDHDNPQLDAELLLRGLPPQASRRRKIHTLEVGDKVARHVISQVQNCKARLATNAAPPPPPPPTSSDTARYTWRDFWRRYLPIRFWSVVLFVVIGRGVNWMNSERDGPWDDYYDLFFGQLSTWFWPAWLIFTIVPLVWTGARVVNRWIFHFI